MSKLIYNKNMLFNYKFLVSRAPKLNPNILPQSGFSNIHNKIYNNQPGLIPKKDNVEIDTSNLKEGDSAPKAYIGKLHFPEWYRPYLLNYHGNGYLVAYYLLTGFIFYIMYKQSLLTKGRESFANHRDEHTLHDYSLYERYFTRDRVRKVENNDMYNYLKRYIKESGF